MKKLVLLFAVGALLLSALSFAPRAFAARSFEDPQLCVNGKLLRVDPTTASIDVWVKVGPDVSVSFDVASCGGDPSLPAVEPSQVSYDGKKKHMEVRVQTDPKAQVVITYDCKTKLVKADKQGWVVKSLKVK